VSEYAQIPKELEVSDSEAQYPQGDLEFPIKCPKLKLTIGNFFDTRDFNQSSLDHPGKN
jgi:hypothetical protein